MKKRILHIVLLGYIFFISCDNKIYNFPNEITNFIVDNAYIPCIELYDENGVFFGCHNNNCIDIDKSCYHESEINFLFNLIQENISLNNFLPLEVGQQNWGDGGRLRSLDLSDLNLSNIPENISNLEMLDTLNIENNDLDKFPNNICDLIDNYCYINSDNNQICNPFPECILYVPNQDCDESLCPEGYRELSNKCYFESDLLIFIDIINLNESVSTFDDLDLFDQDWNFGRLKSLKLENKNLTSLPESIINFDGLRNLELSNNNLTEIPEFIFEIESLRKIDFSNNLITTIPTLINELNNLRILRLSINSIDSFPIEISEMTKLREINLSYNQLSSIPEEIDKLTNLRSLFLNDNYIINIPNSICNLHCECSINLNHNMLCDQYNYNCLVDIGDQNQLDCP